jgi:hypothetical protein
MYRFVLSGMACACDTAKELREAAGLATKPAPSEPRIVRRKRKYRRRKAALENIHVAEEPAAEPPAEPAKKRRKKRAKRMTKQNTYKVADLPIVKGGLGWDVVDRVAKRLGKKVQDKRQLRSDLLKRKNMG